MRGYGISPLHCCSCDSSQTSMLHNTAASNHLFAALVPPNDGKLKMVGALRFSERASQSV